VFQLVVVLQIPVAVVWFVFVLFVFIFVCHDSFGTRGMCVFGRHCLIDVVGLDG
jgi:hypothetical protein